MIIGIVNWLSMDEELHKDGRFECLHDSVKPLGMIDVSVENIKLDVIHGETIEPSLTRLHIKVFLDRLLRNIVVDDKDDDTDDDDVKDVVVVGKEGDGDIDFEIGFNWSVLSCCSISWEESVSRMRSSNWLISFKVLKLTFWWWCSVKIKFDEGCLSSSLLLILLFSIIVLLVVATVLPEVTFTIATVASVNVVVDGMITDDDDDNNGDDVIQLILFIIVSLLSPYSDDVFQLVKLTSPYLLFWLESGMIKLLKGKTVSVGK